MNFARNAQAVVAVAALATAGSSVAAPPGLRLVQPPPGYGASTTYVPGTGQFEVFMAEIPIGFTAMLSLPAGIKKMFIGSMVLHNRSPQAADLTMELVESNGSDCSSDNALGYLWAMGISVPASGSTNLTFPIPIGIQPVNGLICLMFATWNNTAVDVSAVGAAIF